MLLIWSGCGILTVPLVVAASFTVTALVHGLLIAAGRPDLVFVAFSLGLAAAAWANWLVGRRLNGRPPRELLDPKTNERVLLYRRHKLFWINMEYWSVPVPLLALSRALGF